MHILDNNATHGTMIDEWVTPWDERWISHLATNSLYLSNYFKVEIIWYLAHSSVVDIV
jgi:hypothetical protein